MNKTIEEVAREFMETAPIEAVSPYYEEDMIEMFRGGTAHILSLPLSQRLTDEERERVRKEYAEAQSWLDEKPTLDGCNSHLRVCAVAIQPCLESIFGKELFRGE